MMLVKVLGSLPEGMQRGQASGSQQLSLGEAPRNRLLSIHTPCHTNIGAGE